MWKPPPAVSDKEFVGRRVFTTKMFVADTNTFRPDVFFDDRIGTGLSVDRLYIRRVDPEVVAHLSDLGRAAGEKRAKPFLGWAQIKVDQVTDASIAATEADGEKNDYHAEFDRSACTNLATLRFFAFMLASIASKNDFLDAAPGEEKKT